ncbi:MAG: F0F1 ATP synthase subunit epsilon [Acidobacteriota bacterium]|nr:F0F1 ATP synthase subunit epsilon [Acidobacteriota bacterium]
MNKLTLEVLTPEKEAVNRQVDSVYLQGTLGRLGILPEHTTLISTLDFGVLELNDGGVREEMLCGTGLVEVADNRVTVLVRSAEAKGDIDVERAKQAMDRARQRRDSKAEDIDMLRAEASLARAVERLRFSGHQ